MKVFREEFFGNVDIFDECKNNTSSDCISIVGNLLWPLFSSNTNLAVHHTTLNNLDYWIEPTDEQLLFDLIPLRSVIYSDIKSKRIFLENLSKNLNTTTVVNYLWKLGPDCALSCKHFKNYQLILMILWNLTIKSWWYVFSIKTVDLDIKCHSKF